MDPGPIKPFAHDAEQVVPRPLDWDGYRAVPQLLAFWQERERPTPRQAALLVRR